MLTQFVAAHPEERLPVTFDHWSTPPAFCRFFDKTLQIAYIGTLAADDQSLIASGTQCLRAFDPQLQEEHIAALQQGTRPVFQKITIGYKGDQETYYRDCRTHRIHHVGRQRVVINHRKADLSDAAMFLISNTLNGQAQGLTRIRRHRWPVAVSHEEGKAAGRDQYQGRDFQAISRHIALVAVTSR